MSAELWFRRGVEYGIRGELDEEIKCYMKALEIEPKHTKAWKNLGSAFMVKGDIKKGLKTLRIAVQLDPNDLNTWIDMGRLKYNAKDFKGAMDAFKKAIEIKPGLAKSWYWYGLSLSELGLEKEAGEALAMSAKLYKDSGDVESAVEVENKLITISGKH